MVFTIGDLFSLRSFLLTFARTCQLFKNDLMATGKRSKETYSDVIARIRSAEHFNFTRPNIAVGNVSGNSCESDCRSKGREFDLGLVPYFF